MRLPKEFRFEGEEVSICRKGESVVLTPVKRRGWPRGYWKSWGKASRGLELVRPLPAGGRAIDLDEK